MNVGKAANLLGTAVLAGAFLWSVGTVLSRAQKARSGKTQISFAHWNLESGLREAFDAVAVQYMRLHPEVEVTQVPVPGRVYQTWTRTGYAGGTLPDLVVLGGTSDEMLANYFRPLTAEVNTPNPYNQGTALADTPWRETFLDGLSKSYGLETLQEYYSIPIAAATVRMYYNAQLWREILGETQPPRNFAEFIAICRRVQDFAEEKRRAITPIAGSKFTGEMLLGRLFKSQTQRLALEINPERNLAFPANPTALAFLPGLASLDDPAIDDGYAIMREVGQFMQPGFLELDRDDAILRFGQGRALTLPTGVWDYGSIVEQSPFPLGIFEIPMPETDDSRFGKNTLGPVSEAGEASAVSFLVSADSKHPDVAIDFLKFLTSQQGNQIFASISKWPPGIVGVKMAAETREFQPRTEGAIPGISVAPMMYGSGDLYRVQAQNMHLLFGPSGSVARLKEGMRPEFASAVRADLKRQTKSLRDSARRMDGILGGWEFLGRLGDPAAEAKKSALWQAQNTQESQAAWIESELAGAEEQP